MTADDKRKAYQNFFIKTEAGKEFVSEVINLIVSSHEAAEKNPELSRDFVQRACGVREVKNHIDSVVAEPKRGRRIQVS